jgi:hypothetical protein
MHINELIKQLKQSFPGIGFVCSDSFYWSPPDKSVYYVPSSTQPEVATWSLLHEVSHGILGHSYYQSDFQLIELELEAWEKARKLGKKYGIHIDSEHVQDCLDTYRDWLYRRSSCPICNTVSVQSSHNTYTCFNCQTTWGVSNSRFCRPYRRVKKPA